MLCTGATVVALRQVRRRTRPSTSSEGVWLLGANSILEGPAGSVLIRAAVSTGAELIAVPRDELLMDHGAEAHSVPSETRCGNGGQAEAR